MSKHFPGLAPGRIAHYVLPDGKTHRPAIIVHVWDHVGEDLQKKGYCNARVLLDGTNDTHALTGEPSLLASAQARNFSDLWVCSVVFDDANKPDTLHWPERE